MDKVLRHELENAIPELAGEIYPTNAPETSKRPYLVYTRLGSDRIKALDGYADNQSINYMFSIMAKRYEEMQDLRDKLEKFFLTLPNSKNIQDITINNIEETYEFNLSL